VCIKTYEFIDNLRKAYKYRCRTSSCMLEGFGSVVLISVGGYRMLVDRLS
jgi:hypothetical protein